MQSIAAISVRHNAEVAHRLYNMPGKCQNIHGHSMQIELTIVGELVGHGVLAGLEFAQVKKSFRAYIDESIDHHLLLNKDDPWARQLRPMPIEFTDKVDQDVHFTRLPGLITTPDDPTTEHIAKWLCEWAWDVWGHDPKVHAVTIEVSETGTNGAQFTLTDARYAHVQKEGANAGQ